MADKYKLITEYRRNRLGLNDPDPAKLFLFHLLEAFPFVDPLLLEVINGPVNFYFLAC